MQASQLENVCAGVNWCKIDFMNVSYIPTRVCICARALGSRDYGISTGQFSVDLFKLCILVSHRIFNIFYCSKYILTALVSLVMRVRVEISTRYSRLCVVQGNRQNLSHTSD